MESSTTHHCPRTRTSAAGVECKLKYTLVGDQIYIYWSFAQPKCLTAMWEYWIPTDCGVTLLNTPTFVSHNRGLITAIDTTGRAVRACVRALLLLPTQIRYSVKDASAVTHLYRLQAGKWWSGTSEVQPAAETREVSRHRKCAGWWQTDAPPVCWHRPRKHQVRIVPVGSISLIIDSNIVWGFIVKYRAAQIKDEQLDAFSLVWVLPVGRYYMGGGAANSSVSRQWGRVSCFGFLLLERFMIYITNFFSFSRLLLNHGPRDVQELIMEPVIIFERMRVKGKLIQRHQNYWCLGASFSHLTLLNSSRNCMEQFPLIHSWNGATHNQQYTVF